MDHDSTPALPQTQKMETTVTRIEVGQQAVASHGDTCLIVFYGQTIGRRYFLNRPELILGRSDSAHIQIDQDSVSRHHAKIVMQPGLDARLVDLGSTNGTFVNNQRITERVLLDGDLVRVGQTIFKHLSGNNIESKYHEEIYRLTTVDGLTECFNKRYFLEALERELNRAARYRRDLSLAMLDIDHFKKINDTHGHLAGDHVLRELSRILSGSVRKQEIFCRYGGEEFAVIIPEVDLDGARIVCEKLRTLVEQHPFSYNQTPIPVTISLGVHAYSNPEETTEEFIAHADANLYKAKSGGRNRVAG